MQKFPLRMKDNDLLVTELYRDPAHDPVTALSVYLTPKTSTFSPFSHLLFMRLITKIKNKLGNVRFWTINTLKINRLNLQSINNIINENLQNCYLQTFLLDDFEYGVKRQIAFCLYCV